VVTTHYFVVFLANASSVIAEFCFFGIPLQGI